MTLAYKRSDLRDQACHPDMRRGVVAAIGATPRTSAGRKKCTNIRRFGNWCATRYPELRPEAVEERHLVEYAAYVHETARRGARGGWGAAVLAVLEHTGAALPPELRKALSRMVTNDLLAVDFPDGLPDEMKKHIADVKRELAAQVNARIESGGEEGMTEEYADRVLATLRQFLTYATEHNAHVQADAEGRGCKDPASCTEGPMWPLDFNFFYSDPEPMRRYLTDGRIWGRNDSRKSTTTRETRKRRRSESRFVYYTLHELYGIGAPDFLERLTRLTSRGRRGRKDSLGGRKGRDITALEAHERRAVYAVADKRLARAAMALATATNPTRVIAANVLMFAALLAYAIWELALWSGMRMSTLVTLDLQHRRRLKAGSHVFAQANFKAKGAPDLDDQWVAPRAIRRLETLLKFKGLRLELNGLSPEEAWGQAIKLRAGEKYGQKRLLEDRDFHPALTEADGRALTPERASEILSGLLREAGCHETEARAVRHTMASMYLNEFGRSVEEVMTIGHWKSPKVVQRHYAKRVKEAVYEEFDALSEDVMRLEPGAKNILVSRVAASLLRFVAPLADGHGGEHGLASLWNGLVEALDTLAAADPNVPVPSRSIVVTAEQWELVDREIMRISDRHHSLRSIWRTVLGDIPKTGLQAPRIRNESDDAAGAPVPVA